MPLSRQIISSLSKFKYPTHQQLLSLLQTCKSMNEFKQIHAQLLLTDLKTDTLMATKLLEYCAVTARNMDYGVRLFNDIDQPNTYTLTTMIRGFVAVKNHEKAIQFYHLMTSLCVEPNKFTYVFILKAYSMVSACREGRIVHVKLLKVGLQLDIFIRNALINFYSKCSDIDSARNLFDESPSNNLVNWNTMIAASFACGDIKDARKLFDEMPERDVTSWNVAVSGYSKSGHVDLARSLFDKMPERDLVSWSGMIAGYSQSRRASQALCLFKEMQIAAIRPDSFTMSSVLSACSQIGALDMGKWIHSYVDRNKLTHDVVLGTSLVDMYAKCGCIDIALQVFHGMPNKNVLSWNAMLCGLAMHGHGDDALTLFAKMESANVRPNGVTFVGVLSACSHVGSVAEGHRQFDRMTKEFNIVPMIEHYGCMVDLLARAGLVKEAKELIKSMPMEPNMVIWGALLSACKIRGDIEDSESVVNHLMTLAPGDGGCYVLLSNIYAARNRWDEAIRMRVLMRDMGVERVPGCSSIEVKMVVHEFVVGDKLHPNWKEISKVIDRLNTHLENEGYVPNSSLVLYDIDERSLCEVPKGKVSFVNN